MIPIIQIRPIRWIPRDLMVGYNTWNLIHLPQLVTFKAKEIKFYPINRKRRTDMKNERRLTGSDVSSLNHAKP